MMYGFMKRLILLVIFISFKSASAVPTNKDKNVIPAFVKVCHRSDPELNACARESLTALRDHLKVGIPDLYIPPIEPMVIPEIKLDQDSGAIYLHSTYENINVGGLSNYTVTDINIDPHKLKLAITMNFPRIELNGAYVMKGKIMLMPLSGQGTFWLNFTNVDLSTNISGQRFKKNGKIFIKVNEIKVTYKLSKAEMNFENLFNGDKNLGERMNVFLNENWEALSEEMRPIMEGAVSEVVRSTTDKLFKTYSLDQLLPE